MSFRALRPIAAAAALLAAAPAGAAEHTVAVLSSGSGAYMEAFSAFQAQYGTEVPHFNLSEETPRIPEGVKTIVTFGTKAAGYHYPPGADLVYALSPGFFLDPGARTGRTVKISMRPSPARLLARLLEIQPSLKRLRIFWSSPGYATFAADYGAAAAGLGLEVSVVGVERPDMLPGLLRDTLGQADAFWLPPDPLLISPESLMIFREFSLGNRVPMYAATKGLAREGACASLGISFAQAGFAAGAAARALRNGAALPAVIFPQQEELALNASAARQCGIKFTPELLRKAVHLFP